MEAASYSIEDEYYKLRLDTILLVSSEELQVIKELYKTKDSSNVIIAMEIMKSKLK